MGLGICKKGVVPSLVRFNAFGGGYHESQDSEIQLLFDTGGAFLGTECGAENAVQNLVRMMQNRVVRTCKMDSVSWKGESCLVSFQNFSVFIVVCLVCWARHVT